MDSSTIVSLLMSVLAAVLSGIVLATIKNGQAKAKAREEDKEKKVTLMFKSVRTTMSVSEVLIRCIQNEQHNGDINRAKSDIAEVKKDLEDYVDHKAAL